MILGIALLLLLVWAVCIVIGLLVKALFWMTIAGLVLFGLTAVVVAHQLTGED